LAISWTTLITQDGLDGFEIQRYAAAVDQRISDIGPGPLTARPNDPV